MLTSEFIKQWDVGNNSFAKDPPNATVSVMSSDGTSVKDAVVVLKSPKLDGGQLTFDVAVLEGDLANATGPASVFIDWFAARGGLAVWVLSVASASTPQCGVVPGTVIRGLPSQQAPRSVRSGSPLRGHTTTRLLRAVIIPIRLATSSNCVILQPSSAATRF